jgi:hypothetical protein
MQHYALPMLLSKFPSQYRHKVKEDSEAECGFNFRPGAKFGIATGSQKVLRAVFISNVAPVTVADFRTVLMKASHKQACDANARTFLHILVSWKLCTSANSTT